MANIDWSNNAIKTPIMQKLNVDGFTGTTAQQAADYLKTKINPANEARFILAKNNIGMEIARALQSVTPTKTFSVNTQTPLDKGYYVFTGDAFGTTTTNTMASSPIYALVTDSGITITEKSTLPTVLLNIQEDSTNLYSKAADHSFGQLVNYKATATLPINYASFNTYACDFNISANQYDFNTIDNNSISVYLDKDGDSNVSAADKITTGFTITKKGVAEKGSANENGLVISFSNLSSISGLTSDSNIIACFSALAPSDKNNRKMYAQINYSSNPVKTAERGSTVWDVVDDYSYNIKLTKQDKATASKLSGASFVIKNKAGIAIGKKSSAIYEQPSSEAAYVWTTGADGILNINGLDADEYTVEETVAPDSYTKLSAPFKVILAADYSNLLSPTITNTLTDVVDASLVTKQATPASGFAADIIVKNVKNLNLPFTGEQGIVMLVVFGSVLVIIGTGTYLRKRRRLNINIQ